MAAQPRLFDTGNRSGIMWAGQFKLFSQDKKKWMTFDIDTNGDLLLTNHAGETAIVNLT